MNKAKKYTLAEITQKVKDLDLLGIEEIRFIVYGHYDKPNKIRSPKGTDIIDIAEFHIRDDVYNWQGIFTPKGNVRNWARRWFQKYASPFCMTIDPITRPTGINADR